MTSLRMESSGRVVLGNVEGGRHARKYDAGAGMDAFDSFDIGMFLSLEISLRYKEIHSLVSLKFDDHEAVANT